MPGRSLTPKWTPERLREHLYTKGAVGSLWCKAPPRCQGVPRNKGRSLGFGVCVEAQPSLSPKLAEPRPPNGSQRRLAGPRKGGPPHSRIGMPLGTCRRDGAPSAARPLTSEPPGATKAGTDTGHQRAPGKILGEGVPGANPRADARGRAGRAYGRVTPKRKENSGQVTRAQARRGRPRASRPGLRPSDPKNPKA